MEIITGYTGKGHITSEQDRDINIGIIGGGSYVLCTGLQMKAEVSSNNEIKIRDGVLMHQGCAASIKKNTYDSVTIVNGSQGMNRIDLIVARYQRNRDTNVESLKLHVIQGTPAASNPAVPAHTVGDIQGGALVADMPLYQVKRTELNITEVKKVFETMDDIVTIKSEIASLNRKSTSTLILSKTKVTEGQNIAFSSTAKELLIYLLTQSNNKTSIRIPNVTSSETYIISAVWATNTTSRITFKRTNTGLSILSSYGEGLWQSVDRHIEIYGIG